MKCRALGQKRGENALERGHNEEGLELRSGKHRRRVEQLEFCGVVADGLRELGILLFGQCLHLFLLVIPVLDVLHHRRIDRLINLVVRAGQVSRSDW